MEEENQDKEVKEDHSNPPKNEENNQDSDAQATEGTGEEGEKIQEEETE